MPTFYPYFLERVVRRSFAVTQVFGIYLIGALREPRTPDLLITSQSFYQLNYQSIYPLLIVFVGSMTRH